MQYDKSEVIKITGIYMGLNIGAGFISGQEIMQFFSAFGLWGYCTGVVTFLLMFYGGESIVDAGYLCRKRRRTSVFEYFCGKKLGTFYNIVIPLLLYGVYLVMISGAGSVLEQFFKIPNFYGRIAVISLSVITLFLNFDKLSSVISNITRIIVMIVLVILFVSIIQADFSKIFDVKEFLANNSVIKASDSFYGAGILYGCSILLASSQFLFDTGRKLTNRFNGFLGILFGTLGFVMVALVIHTGILLYFQDVHQLPILTLFLAEQVSPTLSMIVAVLLFVVMYSASTISLWSSSNMLRVKFAFWRMRYYTVIVLLGAFAIVLSSIPFAMLVNILYPINGMFGILFLFMIIIKNRKYLNYEER